MKILIAGYPYIRPYYFDTFKYYPAGDRIYFLLPKIWKVKRGTIIFRPPNKKNVYNTKAFFYHSKYPIIGGLLKGWMPAFPLFVIKTFGFQKKGLVYSSTEPILLTTLYQGLWAKLFGLKHVIFTWENIDYEKKFKGLGGLIKKTILRWNMSLSDGLICGNQKAQHILARLTEKPLVTIPLSGVNVDFLKPHKDKDKAYREKYDLKNKIVFTFVGAIGYRKGIHIIIGAMEFILRKIPNVHLVIVGSGEDAAYEQKIEHLIRRIKGHVTKIPWIRHDDLVGLLSASDIFLYPSISYGGWEEQFGYSIAEASLMRLPVISTRSGSIDEVVVHGKTGLLIEEKNQQALLKAMIKLAMDKHLREEMGSAGRYYIIKKFSHRIVAEKFYRFFKQVSV